MSSTRPWLLFLAVALLSVSAVSAQTPVDSLGVMFADGFAMPSDTDQFELDFASDVANSIGTVDRRVVVTGVEYKNYTWSNPGPRVYARITVLEDYFTDDGLNTTILQQSLMAQGNNASSTLAGTTTGQHIEFNHTVKVLGDQAHVVLCNSNGYQYYDSVCTARGSSAASDDYTTQEKIVKAAVAGWFGLICGLLFAVCFWRSINAHMLKERELEQQLTSKHADLVGPDGDVKRQFTFDD